MDNLNENVKITTEPVEKCSWDLFLLCPKNRKDIETLNHHSGSFNEMMQPTKQVSRYLDITFDDMIRLITEEINVSIDDITIKKENDLDNWVYLYATSENPNRQDAYLLIKIKEIK